MGPAAVLDDANNDTISKSQLTGNELRPSNFNQPDYGFAENEKFSKTRTYAGYLTLSAFIDTSSARNSLVYGSTPYRNFFVPHFHTGTYFL